MQLPAGGKITHIDFELMRLQMKLTPGQRVLAMLDARELTVGIMRGRLMREHPELSHREISLLIIEEIERAKRYEFRPLPLFPRPTQA